MFSLCSYMFDYQNITAFVIFCQFELVQQNQPNSHNIRCCFNTENKIHISYHRYPHFSSLKLCRQVFTEIVLSHFRKKLTSCMSTLGHTFPLFPNSEASGLSSVLSIPVGELDTLIILGETGFEFALNAVSTSESSLVSGDDSYSV